MNRKHFIANAVLWAVAIIIIASAIVGAPPYFSAVLLPVLAASALLITWPGPDVQSIIGAVQRHQDAVSAA